jgi:putative CocE/NonD family hydrolase
MLPVMFREPGSASLFRLLPRVSSLAALILFAQAVSCIAQTNSASIDASDLRVQIHQAVPMRDGVILSADIYRPTSPGKFPSLLLRTYWGKHEPSKIKMALYFAKRGYAVVIEDVRGRFDSGGQWTPYVHEPEDGYDTQMWVGKQPWSNGKIGLFGESYDGFTQLMPAPLHSPYVKAMVPFACQQTNFGHLYNDGILQLGTVYTAGLFMVGHTLQPTIGGVYGPGIKIIDWDSVFRRLPLISALDSIADVPWVKDWIRHDEYSDYWASYGLKGKYSQIQAPAYFVTGWYDNLVHETWHNFISFREQGGSAEARRGTKIIVGPWIHGGAAPDKNWPVDFGPDSNIDLNDLHVRWYDQWLKSDKPFTDDGPPIRLFVMGANMWRFENEWPLKRTKWTSFYLSSQGKANSLSGDGALSEAKSSQQTQDHFTYDPNNPVPTVGGQIAIFPDVWGPRARNEVQKRGDVLVYTTPTLKQDLEVTGPVELKLYAATSTVDTDFTATLTDVYPDGKAVLLCEGIRGVRFRESLEHPTPVEPGRVYEYTISLWETSNVFKAGHRIRLEVSSSNFPRYARNQNTGEPFGMSAETKIAEQTIYHNDQYPSQLILPVIP